jgi:putative PIN family toxin of toxin-antitoxin system
LELVIKRIVDSLKDRKFQAVYSRELFAELLDVVSRPRFGRKFTQIDAVTLLKLISQSATLVDVAEKEAISRDPHDDIVLACAAAAGANYLVTGDDDLLCLKNYRGTMIITPAQFIEVLAQESID